MLVDGRILGSGASVVGSGASVVGSGVWACRMKLGRISSLTSGGICAKRPFAGNLTGLSGAGKPQLKPFTPRLKSTSTDFFHGSATLEFMTTQQHHAPISNSLLKLIFN